MFCKTAESKIFGVGRAMAFINTYIISRNDF